MKRLTRGNARGNFYIGHIIDHCNPPRIRWWHRVGRTWTCECGKTLRMVAKPNTYSGEPHSWFGDHWGTPENVRWYGP